MKKEILNSAWEHITVSDECIGDLLDSLDDVPVITKRPHKKVSYLAIVTAAVVFMCGGIGVAAEAGAFDWIKGFFAEEVVVDEKLSDLVSEIEDFECDSSVGAVFSPIGVIYDGSEIYCMLKIDKLPEDMDRDHITVSDLTINGKSLWEIAKDGNGMYGSIDNNFLEYESDMLAIRGSIHTNKGESVIKDGDRITFTLCGLDEKGHAPDGSKESDISFTLREGKYNVLDIDYNKYTCDEIPKRQYDFMFDNVKITPLSFFTNGKSSVYANAKINDDVRIVFDDGTEITAGSEGYGSSYSGDMRKAENLPTVAERVKARGEYHTTSERHFSKPIDPDKIVKVYLGDMCIFKRDEKVVTSGKVI